MWLLRTEWRTMRKAVQVGRVVSLVRPVEESWEASGARMKNNSAWTSITSLLVPMLRMQYPNAALWSHSIESEPPGNRWCDNVLIHWTICQTSLVYEKLANSVNLRLWAVLKEKKIKTIKLMKMSGRQAQILCLYFFRSIIITPNLETLNLCFNWAPQTWQL